MQYSIVKYSELNIEKRIDAEYYRKDVLDNLNIISASGKTLDHYVDFIIGPFGSTVTTDKYVDDSYYSYIRNKDINNFVIGDNEIAKIPKELYDSLPQFHIKKNDLLVTVVGTLGKVAIAQEKDTKSIFSCKSTILRSHSINPYYLLVYLNSSIGQKLVLRGKRGAIQEGLNLIDLKEIIVYNAGKKLQNFMENIVKKYFSLIKMSMDSYERAKTILLNELNLTNYTPTQTLSYIKNFSDTQDAQRFDAEYFQPMYDEIINAIKSYKNGFCELDYLIDDFSTGYPYKSETYIDKDGIPLIRINNIHDGQLDLNNIVHIPKSDILLSEKDIATKGDILISMSGTIGSSCKVDTNTNLVINQRIFRFTPKNIIDSSILPLIINSCIGFQQLKRVGTGGVQTNISSKDIRKILVPKLYDDVQTAISNNINKSLKLKKDSSHLLKIAKIGIELAIEQDEDMAIDWMKNQISMLGVSIDAR